MVIWTQRALVSSLPPASPILLKENPNTKHCGALRPPWVRASPTQNVSHTKFASHASSPFPLNPSPGLRGRFPNFSQSLHCPISHWPSPRLTQSFVEKFATAQNPSHLRPVYCNKHVSVYSTRHLARSMSAIHHLTQMVPLPWVLPIPALVGNYTFPTCPAGSYFGRGTPVKKRKSCPSKYR